MYINRRCKSVMICLDQPFVFDQAVRHASRERLGFVRKRTSSAGSRNGSSTESSTEGANCLEMGCGALELKPLEDAEPLCEAAAKGNYERVKDILTNHCFADPNACKEYMYTKECVPSVFK